MDWLKLLKRKGQTYRQLSGTEHRLFLSALLLFPIVVVCLKLRGLKRTQKLILWLCGSPSTYRENEKYNVILTARMVRLAAQYNGAWETCLSRSLVLWGLLSRQGISSELRIGVRREEGHFEAHAWIEYEGVALNEYTDLCDRYSAFDRPIEVKL